MIFIINFESNKDHPRNEKVVEIENIKGGTKSFDITYKNVFAWLKAMRQDGFALSVRTRN